MTAHSKVSVPLPRSISSRTPRQLLGEFANFYISNRTRISRGVYLALFVVVVSRVRNAINEQKAAVARAAEVRQKGPSGQQSGDAKGRKKVELNREFFRNLGRLLRICVPGWKSKELRLILSHSIFLVLRTLISLYVAELDGELVSNLVKGKAKEFLKSLVWWMLVAVPATFTNSMVWLCHRLGHVELIDNSSYHTTRQHLLCDTARSSPTTSTINISTT